ncbi:hypothetical protein K438DRAFT_323213 [Mycena galopus ATCC 62051]|nr:hypothetical protein K438DRAFT_323213 [Mycena galopus ATCC 62051]
MNVSPPVSSSSSSEVLTSPPSSISSLFSNESPRQIRERLLRTKQTIIDEMNQAARAVVLVRKPKTCNWEEREKVIKMNAKIEIDAMMPYIEKLQAWEGQLSPEEKAAMKPTEEEEAHSEQRLAEILEGQCCY